jgi:hypothetical protein
MAIKSTGLTGLNRIHRIKENLYRRGHASSASKNNPVDPEKSC